MADPEAHGHFTTGYSSAGHGTRFSMKGKRFFITYPHCMMTKERALEIMRERFGENIKEIVICEEKHDDDTPHLHVLLNMKHMIRLTIEGAKLDDFVGHIEMVRCPVLAKRYTMKGGVYIVYPNKDVIRQKKATIDELLHENINKLVNDEKLSVYSVERLVKARRILEMTQPPMKEKPHVLWFFGETGYGKTREAIEIANAQNETYWISNGTLQWFDGYMGQAIAILDEVRGNSCDWSFFLRLLDRYRLMVPVKGGFVNWTPKMIIITSSGKPEDVFVNHGTGEVWDSIKQLLRRIDEVWQFYAEGEKRCIMERGQETTPMQLVPPAIELEETAEEEPRTEFFYEASPIPGPNDVPHLDPEQEPMNSFIQKGN